MDSSLTTMNSSTMVQQFQHHNKLIRYNLFVLVEICKAPNGTLINLQVARTGMKAEQDQGHSGDQTMNQVPAENELISMFGYWFITVAKVNVKFSAVAFQQNGNRF